MVKAIKTTLIISSAYLLVLFLSLIKLLVKKKIIFCQLHGTDRIGHMAANTEIFLRRLKHLNHFQKNEICLGYCSGKNMCNRQLLNMYKKRFPIVEKGIAFAVLNSETFKRTAHYYRLPFNSNEYHEFNSCGPILSFTKDEKNKGREELGTMGIGESDWFVCFHARDRKYLGAGSEYHDYRDCKISNYLKAAEYIAEMGGYAIRMGSVVEEALPKNIHPRIIDYATKYRSDIMDIYLPAHCKFFLGNTSGLFLIASIFDVPVACANFIPLEITPMRKGDLYIPKKLFDSINNKYLSSTNLFFGLVVQW